MRVEESQNFGQKNKLMQVGVKMEAKNMMLNRKQREYCALLYTFEPYLLHYIVSYTPY